MSLPERIQSVEEILAWTDALPLRYRYSIGHAGEKFSDGMKNGKIVCARCDRCSRSFLPPTVYCEKCFHEVTGFAELGSEGEVYSYAENSGKIVAMITFPKTEGALIHLVEPGVFEVKIGSKVHAVFKPAHDRTGDITDIVCFRITG